MVCVRYSDGQEEYESKLNVSGHFYRIGDMVKVYYDSGKPYVIWMREDSYSFLWGVFGVLFLITGVAGCVAIAIKSKKINWLKEHGRCIEAVVTDITLDFSANIKWKYPYIVACEYTDKVNQCSYHFRSDYFWTCPEHLKQGDKITVLVHPDNYLKYYVKIPDECTKELSKKPF